jgi:hypothetical protein
LALESASALVACKFSNCSRSHGRNSCSIRRSLPLRCTGHSPGCTIRPQSPVS